MTALERVTLCFFGTGDPLVLPGSCLEALLDKAQTCPSTLHLGFSQAPVSWRHVLGRLCPHGNIPSRGTLPGGVERFSWTVKGGMLVHAWISDRVLCETRLTTTLLTDVPVTTEYVLWFDQCSRLEVGWWELLLPLLEKGIDCVGHPEWVEYSPRDAERLQGRPWYRGVPLERRANKPGVSFMSRFWGLRTACFREVEGTGERNWSRWASEQSGGWPVLLGEIARQLNWSRAEYQIATHAAPH
jgi:hypothetical protein